MTREQFVFERIEIKYLLSPAQRGAILDAMREWGYHVDDYGESTVSNIYYDTADYALIRRSLEKPVYKEKLRLRAYGAPGADSPAFVEIKKKFRGVVYKRRVELPYREAEAAVARGEMPGRCGQIGREIDWFLRFYQVSPRVMLAYDREAYYSERFPDTRITFDRKIRCRDTALDLTRGAAGVLLLPGDTCLMEVKTAFALPKWLCGALYRAGARQTSFSKYGEAYKNFLNPTGRTEARFSA